MNTTDLLVITSYPKRGQTHGAGTVGIASYAKNTLLAIKAYAEKFNIQPRIVVLAEKLMGDSGIVKNSTIRGGTTPRRRFGFAIYKEKGIEVRRVWERNSILSFFTLLREIVRHKDTRKVLIEYELSMFGDPFASGIFLLFIFILKVFKKETIVVFHQVISDINHLSGHIDLEPRSIKADIINVLLSIFYKSVCTFSSKIIVFEKMFKERLSRFTNTRKIIVIPHGVESFVPPSEESSLRSATIGGVTSLAYKQARKKLKIKNNEFIILYFGFIAWYKGADWLVDKVKSIATSHRPRSPASGQATIGGVTPLKLIIAGGENPNHKDKKHYQEYVDRLYKKISPRRSSASRRSTIRRVKTWENNIMVTGFVSENKIPLYFSACDLVVLPYRAFMASSGPLSFAFSFKKPFLLSDNMAAILDTCDIKHEMKKVRLSKEDVTFDLHSLDFDKKISNLLKNPKKLEKITRLSQNLERARSFKVIGEMYYKELFVDQ